MKSLIDFEKAQPFATRFFTHALLSQSLVNTYLLHGRDFPVMYRMVLRLAQIINCQNKSALDQACGCCQSCQWIEQNAHPGVITISKLTYLVHVDPETGASKSKSGKAQKQIHVGQMENLLRELSLHSGGFHRVVILTGAEEVSETLESEQNSALFPVPRDWQPAEKGQFKLSPLDRRCFPDELANKFLKTLEEPPRDVVFFLLTDSEEKLLETIISRCQRVPFATPPDIYQVSLPLNAREAYDQLLKGISHEDPLYQTRSFLAYLAEAGIEGSEGITQFQQFLWEAAQYFPAEPHRFYTMRNYLLQLEQAKRKIEDKVREEAVIEDLFVQLSQGKTLNPSLF